MRDFSNVWLVGWRAPVRTVSLVLLLIGATLQPAHATLQSAQSIPARATVSAAQAATLSISWRITTNPAHADGAISAGGSYVNAATGAPLGPTIPITVGSVSGTGPLIYAEVISLSTQQIAQWRSQGVRQVGYRRTFTAVASPPRTAQFLITLQTTGLDAAREPSGELQVARMELSFTDGKRIAIADRNASLRAQLSLNYSGSGTLRGRWEVAEPASSGSVNPSSGNEPFFRMLSMVREVVGAGQQITLSSLPLPTAISGRYVLRFCVETVNDICGNSLNTVQTLYEVLPNEVMPVMRGVVPNGQTINSSYAFRWPIINNASTYQLQIFRPAVTPQTEPTFVSGMLVPQETTQTALSLLVLEKLTPGQRYLWRVTAHDANGQLLARSDAVAFVYAP